MRALTVGAATLDLLIGDPPAMPHPVAFAGACVRFGEPIARRAIADERAAGALLSLATVGVALLAGMLADRAPAPVRGLFGASTLACGSLLDHVRPIRDALASGDLPSARHALARVVGRDTQRLDETEIARATIETLAESLCDGVIAPLLYLRTFGVAGAFAYKAINTLDSAIGHHEAPYEAFGGFAARLDDLANLVPARISALLIAVCAPMGGGDVARALDVLRADGRKHRSPNAGQSEAAMAGALGVRLGGTNRYDGVAVETPYLGARFARPQASDIERAVEIVFAASVVAFVLASL